MSITLESLTLPADLVWEGEFSYSTVVQKKDRSLTGSLLVQESVRLKGRPIKLSGDESSGWIPRADLITLQGMADTVDSDMTLNFHGTNYTVRFDREGGSPVQSAPIINCTDPDTTAPYSVTVNLMTV